MYPHLHLDEQLQRADDLTPDEILSICADIRQQRQEAADKRIAGGSFDCAIDEMERRERETTAVLVNVTPKAERVGPFRI